MIFKCKKCGVEISNDLIELKIGSALCEIDGKDYVPIGMYHLSQGEFFIGSESKIIINKNDLINCNNHPNGSKLNGCCGLDGMDGANKVCINGHEVATECSDCWMPHAVILN
jgi:hypothetical protein